MLKSQLDWSMRIQDINGDFQEFGYPLTIDMDIARNTMASAQDAEFTVYNLSEDTRNLIRKNAGSIDSMSDYREIQFFCGYQDNPTLIFKGQVVNCNSAREGVDWMTSISCKDPGLIQTNDISYPLAAGTLYAQNIKSILDSFMPGVTIGTIGHIFDSQPSLLKGNSYSGSVLNILSQLTGGNFSGGNLFFENQRLFILQDFETLPAQGFTLLQADTGLLGSPTFEETFIHARMFFEPQIIMAQKLTLKSETQKWLNGTRKVVAYNHSGTISGSVASEAFTEVSLYAPLNSRGFEVLALGAVF